MAAVAVAANRLFKGRNLATLRLSIYAGGAIFLGIRFTAAGLSRLVPQPPPSPGELKQQVVQLGSKRHPTWPSFLGSDVRHQSLASKLCTLLCTFRQSIGTEAD